MESTDGGALQTARRETEEELGLSKEDLVIIAPLDILVTPFNTIVYPFLSQIKDHSKIQPTNEVESVFYVPLDFLLRAEPIDSSTEIKLLPPENFNYELIPNGVNYGWRGGVYPVYFYIWEDRVIWGMTARILRHFIDLYREVG